MAGEEPPRPGRAADRYRKDPDAKLDRPPSWISGPSRAAIHIDETEDRPRPLLGIVCGTAGATILAAALSVPLGVATGLEPAYSIAPIALAGFVLALRRFRRQAAEDPPTRKQAVHTLWAFAAIAVALVLLCEVGYLWWLKRTSKLLVEKEWTLLSGMSGADVERVLGRPARVESTPAGERWVYEARFVRLPRYRLVSEIAPDGRFVKSTVDSAKERWAVWAPLPGI